MNEQIQQTIDNIAQFVTDLVNVRNELLLSGEIDIYNDLSIELLELSNELIQSYHTFRAVASVTEEEQIDFVPDDEEDVTPLEEASIFNLEDARNEIDLDQRSRTKFAKDAGITRDTLKRFMSGTVKPHDKTLRGIEKALGLKEGALDE